VTGKKIQTVIVVLLLMRISARQLVASGMFGLALFA
jgi:hypothetical protein